MRSKNCFSYKATISRDVVAVPDHIAELPPTLHIIHAEDQAKGRTYGVTVPYIRCADVIGLIEGVAERFGRDAHMGSAGLMLIEELRELQGKYVSGEQGNT